MTAPCFVDANVLVYTQDVRDALIVAAAQLQDCRFLYSEDLHHGAVYDGVQVRNPFMDQVNEPARPAYVAPRKVSPHRSRGRPRKAVLIS